MNDIWNTDTALATNTHDAEVIVESERVRTPTLAKAPDDDSGLAMMIRHAQGITREPKVMLAAAKQIGGLLASDGFYRFPTGGATVEGASIGLAEALAQSWKCIAYTVHVLNVEHLATGGRRVHLRARVVDMHSLVVSEVDQVVATSAPPGGFARKEDQAERWHTMQVQSATSKIVRNVILRVLPDWYVQAALQAAYAQAAQNATQGKSLPDARQNAVKVLGERTLTLAELEKYTNTPVDLWAVPQLQMLAELNRDLARGTLSVEQFRKTLDGTPAAPTTQALPESNGKTALGTTKRTAPATVDAAPAP